MSKLSEQVFWAFAIALVLFVIVCQACGWW